MAPTNFQQLAAENGGLGGAEEEDDTGSIWVTTGNEEVTTGISDEIPRGEEYRWVNPDPKNMPAYETHPVKRKLEDVWMDLYRMNDPNEIQKLQERLFAGGFYGGLKRNQINWRTPDEVTADAFKTALERTAHINDTGFGNKTYNDVIDDAARERADAPKEYSFSNPDDIRALIQATAPQVFGRRADDAVVDALTRNYLQFEAMQQDNGAEGKGSPSQSWVSEQLRQLNPTSAEAYQQSTNVDSFLQLMANKDGLFSAYRQ